MNDLCRYFDNCLEINAKIETADNEQLFICTRDYQGGDWCVGYLATEQDWIQRAMDWAISDEYDTFDIWRDTPQDTIEAIGEYWSICIEPYDPDNPEHKQLAEEGEH